MTGILWANITAFGHPPIAYSWPDALPGGGAVADGWVWLFQYVFVDGKFRGLFTILFGAGMLLFMDRAWERGQGRGLQARRLAFLGLFGLIHFFLIWWGDILFMYSLAGFMALLFLRLSPRAMLLWAIGLYALGGLLFTGGLYFQMAVEQSGEPAAVARQMTEALNAQLDHAAALREAFSGSYADIVAANAQLNSMKLGFYPILAVVETLPLMLVGMAMYRTGFFEGYFGRSKLLGWGAAGIVVSAVWSAWLGWGAMHAGFPFYYTQYVANGIAHLARLPMVLGYAAVLAAIAASASRGWLGARIVAAGRVAFTNYIGTSVLMMFVFQGWALGLFGQLSRLELLVPMVAAWAIMLAWSKPWLERYRYGPLEWLWRCLTYGRRFAIRR